MKTLFALLLSSFFSLTVFGTGQISDKIIYNGKIYELLYSNPMESYFKEHSDKHPQKESIVLQTGLRRGYVATFEIIGKQLYLKDIEIRVDGNWKSVLNEIFPNQKLIKIDWITEIFVLPAGKIIDYVHYGAIPKYENYILLEIDKGNLKKEKQFEKKEYEEFKEKQFQVFKKTSKYETDKLNLQKKGWSNENIDNYILESDLYIIEYISKILVEW